MEIFGGNRYGNFYPRPPRGGRQGRPHHQRRRASISIHALREEGDRRRGRRPPLFRNFYPRPPRGGRPLKDEIINREQEFLSTPSARRATVGLVDTSSKKEEFLSTPSARRATSTPRFFGGGGGYFYPRPPRGGRHTARKIAAVNANFYPRPPRGGRPIRSSNSTSVSLFLSTPSARRATHHR